MLLPGVVTDLWAKLRRAAVFVSVSLYEGCPNTVLKAMAADCLLVVSDIPAHRALLDDQIGMFVNPDDPRAGRAGDQSGGIAPGRGRRSGQGFSPGILSGGDGAAV